MRSLALFSVVTLLAVPASAAVTHEREGEVAKAAVVVVRGSADAMEQVLARAKVNFVVVTPEELADLPLHSKQVVMVNCRGEMSEQARQKLKRFVTAGGFLYTTDHAVKEVIEKIFPNTLAWTGRSTTEEIVSVKLGGSEEDRGLLNALGGNSKELWQVASGGYPVKVLDPKRVKVLMSSEVVEQKYGTGVIAARFRWEDGQVIHVTGHFFSQPGQSPQQVAASGARAFEQLSTNIVQTKAADGERIDSLYGSATNREVTLQAAPTAAAPAAPTRARPVSNGEKLKVLEKKQDYSRVRDTQGNEGWVPNSAL
ncbi:MAG: hypothetical protein JNM17_02935 [Archangium sp.]|nr:hypothetical protein [Archangium sp.]